MCGIAGFLVDADSRNEARMTATLRVMTDAIVHRGPDDSGTWCDPAAGIGLGHRRLSIIDLSPLGHQPMTSRSGRYVICFNGEIYNYKSLAAELVALGWTFRGTSDTEVLLAGIEAWGFEATLKRSTGMFALAVWDNTERCLHLARDRFGEKPIYIGEFGQVFGFASELKALRAHEDFRADIDRVAVALLLRHGYIPAPHSIYRGIRKLRAGWMATVSRRNGVVQIQERPYWDVVEFVAGARRAPQLASPQEAVDAVERAVTEAVRLQMVADVPVGAFLSGGVDSSLVVAIMQRLNSQPVRTFSIGFWDPEFNEAPYARAVADHLGTHHTELIVTPQDALQVIPNLPQLYDEPFADSSQIPTFLLASMARRDVTVSLSGDGGDELFGGYSRYGESAQRWRSLEHVPRPLRSAAASLVAGLPHGALTLLTSPLLLSGSFRRRGDLADRIKERAVRWQSRSSVEAYKSHATQWQSPERVVLGTSAAELRAAAAQALPAGLSPLQEMMFVDMCHYMTDDVLVKVDRAAMAASLETRVPLLDPAVAEVAWRIPSSLQWRDGRGKWPLRQLLDRYVPRALIDRPKRGFAVPMARWLRAELKPWAADLLDPARLRSEGYLAEGDITRRWKQHQSGGTDWSFHLWNVLMFQSWLSAGSNRANAVVR